MSPRAGLHLAIETLWLNSLSDNAAVLSRGERCQDQGAIARQAMMGPATLARPYGTKTLLLHTNNEQVSKLLRSRRACHQITNHTLLKHELCINPGMILVEQ